ncbi:MAG: hypothetical protein CSA47_02615 [Gammaproteobacteria bacterium]|nr:MAG: hypothetical protein CSA47_02615 [Gammaproteobacteria bacterium]
MKTNVTVRIMDSDYQLLCDVEEKELLIRSADVLSQHLKSFRRDNPSIDVEKLLVMGALRSTCELVSELDTLSDQAKIANNEMQKTLAMLADDGQ